MGDVEGGDLTRIETSKPGPQPNTKLVIGNAVLIGVGGLLGLIGTILGSSALLAATRRWAHQLDTQPSELAWSGSKPGRRRWPVRTRGARGRLQTDRSKPRQVLVISGGEGTALLDTWLTWAWHGPRPPYATLARSIRDHPRRASTPQSPRDCPTPRVESVITKLPLPILVGRRTPNTGSKRRHH